MKRPSIAVIFSFQALLAAASVDANLIQGRWDASGKAFYGDTLLVGSDKITFTSGKFKTDYEVLENGEGKITGWDGKTADYHTFILKSEAISSKSCGWQYIRLSIPLEHNCLSSIFFYEEDGVFKRDRANKWNGKYVSAEGFFALNNNRCR
jgi:hypothetical protein